MDTAVATSLLPVLFSRSEEMFNVFDVMHHGTHEKQLSNVFAWLLDAEGTHHLGTAFQVIFIDAVNRGLQDGEPLSPGAFSVRQEVNTSEADDALDIADLVLEDHETTIVVENYYTSDGHGHSYARYREFGRRDGKRGVVVMLCETERRTSLVDGWELAPVVVYADVLVALARRVAGDPEYQRKYPDQCSFFDHLQRRFVKGRRVNDDNLIDFIDALCRTGEAERFGWKNREDAALRFGDRLRDEAITHFKDGRELLTRTKHRLQAYCEATLIHQVNSAWNARFLTDASASYQGRYEWTVNLVGERESMGDGLKVQLKFGPSAWYANEKDSHWEKTVPAADADYTRLFVTRGKEIRQSAVSMQEALDGLSPDDFRLRDEVIDLARDD